MGSKYENRALGSLGDAGIYSLDRGKPLSAYLGGIAVTANEDIAAQIRQYSGSLMPIGLGQEMMILMKLIIYAIFLRPWLYWLPSKMPFLKLGQTTFDVNFDLADLSNIQISAAAKLYYKLERVNRERKQNAHILAKSITASGKYEVPGFENNELPIYLRLPVLARTINIRDNAIRILRQNGIAAGILYPSTISRINGVEEYLAPGDTQFAGAQHIVDHMLTLPTHPYLKNKDLKKIASCLERAAVDG